LLPTDNAAQTNDRRGGFMIHYRAHSLSAQVILLDLQPAYAAWTATPKQGDSFGEKKPISRVHGADTC
jgi:hypothetical protein